MVYDIKELEKLLKILRKNGVDTFKNGEIELKLAPLAERPSRYMRKKQGDQNLDIPKENPPYTPEEILMWSSTPPGLDPGN